VSTSADFATQISGSPFTVASGLTSAVTGLTSGATYYYRLAADKIGVTGQGGFSNTITLATGALPLKLILFTAFRKDNNSVLNWVTDNEVNTHYTNIEFSTNGIDWEVIGKVNNNNTAGKNDYQFTHPLTANNQLRTTLYYRLKQVDLDGKYSYSEVRLVKQSNNQTAGILVYPNPVKNGKLNIDLGENITKSENYTITTVEGKTVQQGSINYRQQVINVGNLVQGTYLLKVGNRKTQVIVCE
jgi:hypothetical protein